MNKTEKEEIKEMLDEYWNYEDPNIDYCWTYNVPTWKNDRLHKK